MTAAQSRYLVDGFLATSLENNPAGSPVERFVNIYLPPGYYEAPQRGYPVIYFLHGHGGNYHKATISDTSDIKKLDRPCHPQDSDYYQQECNAIN
jgi:S-formylglutathione hydrolase FrmB